MKSSLGLLALAFSCQGTLATPYDPRSTCSPSLFGRAFSDAPDGYAPAKVPCPADLPAIRAAGSLAPNETEWLEKRRPISLEGMRDFLVRANISGFDAGKYFSDHADNSSALPNYGIAYSGGGWRALMNGAGAFAAFDNRTVNSTHPGQLGGLLQGATYVAGLSGGSWLVGSIWVNNFTTVTALRDAGNGSVWQFGNSILEGPAKNGPQILNTAEYYAHLLDIVAKKMEAGFDTTLTDYWGRALSYQLIEGNDGGPGITWSSISLDPQFSTGLTPMPIVVADGRSPNEFLLSTNTTVFDITPFEFGTSDTTVYGYAPLRYLGTNFTAGHLTSGCVRGFDNAGFIMGTSSSLFNTFLLNLNYTNVPDALKGALRDILNTLSESDEDIADYTPNPFFGWNPSSNPGAGSDRLTVVDGGEDLQNIPLHPLIQRERVVDVIFAVDASADTSNWPNATALVATYQRSLDPTINNASSFPAVPDQNTIVNLGLNTRPTFFGCDSKNFTGGQGGPIIVYIPAYPYNFFANISTFQFSTNNSERNVVIQNGYNSATLANSTRPGWDSSDWPQCVGCAVLQRSFERTGQQIPDECQSCFKRYCWDGTLNSTEPLPYEPALLLQATDVSISAKGGKKSDASLTMGRGGVWRLLTVGLGVAGFAALVV